MSETETYNTWRSLLLVIFAPPNAVSSFGVASATVSTQQTE